MNIGSFEITSGSIVVSDPCYNLSDSLADNCMVKNINAVNGTWLTDVTYEDNRVKIITAYHSQYNDIHSTDVLEGVVCVDSAQAGIYDQSSFKNDAIVENLPSVWEKIILEHKNLGRSLEPICPDEPWYSLNCARTMSINKAGVIPFGVVSSSGYGDGCYDLTINKNENDQAVSISILFFDINNVEDDYDEDYEDDYDSEYRDED